jgi:hypothetical protein
MYIGIMFTGKHYTGKPTFEDYYFLLGPRPHFLGMTGKYRLVHLPHLCL